MARSSDEPVRQCDRFVERAKAGIPLLARRDFFRRFDGCSKRPRKQSGIIGQRILPGSDRFAVKKEGAAKRPTRLIVS